MVTVEFCPFPRWTPRATADKPQLMLREPGSKRAQILFYTTPSMPPGLGFLATRQPTGTFALLSYQASEQNQISRAAVEVIDSYLENLDLATGQFQPSS